MTRRGARGGNRRVIGVFNISQSCILARTDLSRLRMRRLLTRRLFDPKSPRPDQIYHIMPYSCVRQYQLSFRPRQGDSYHSRFVFACCAWKVVQSGCQGLVEGNDGSSFRCSGSKDIQFMLFQAVHYHADDFTAGGVDATHGHLNFA